MPPPPTPTLRRYKDCEPLLLTAPNGTQFKFPGVRELLKPGAVAVDTALLPPDAIGAPAAGAGGAAAAPPVPPLSAAQVCNQLRLHMRRSISGYYQGRLRSDDDMAPCDTRNVCLAVREDARPGSVPPDPRCTGTMRQVVSEAQLYTQVGLGGGLGGGALHGGPQAGPRGWWLVLRAAPPPPGLPPLQPLFALPPLLPPTPPRLQPATRSCPTSTACLTWRACCTRWTAPRRARRRSRSWSPSGAAGGSGVLLGWAGAWAAAPEPDCRRELLNSCAGGSDGRTAARRACSRPCPPPCTPCRRPVLDEGARAAATLRDASGFRWVDLGSMFGKLAALTAAH